MKPKCEKYYREDGSIEKQTWRLNNTYHKVDGPAIIYYYENYSIETECWFLNSKRHRTDGPAIINYREDGSVESECWYLNDKLHRTDGSAIVCYRIDGSVERENWYLNDNRINPEEHLIPTPKTEENKVELINEFVFVEENNKYIFIKDWLKRDKEFYDKYRILIK